MSLYGMMRTGVSGMAAQSTRLATVADNIANSSTNGYKRASVEFASMVIPNSGTSYVSGGVSTQVRYAISLEGNTQYTTSATDLAIKGDGFFVVQNGNGQPLLTRAGSFVPDGQGRLVNAAGFYLMGYNFANGQPSPVLNGFGGLEQITIPANDMSAVPSTFGTLSANLPFSANIVTGLTPADGYLGATGNAAGTIPDGNFTAKSSLTVVDNVGQEMLLDIYYTKTGANTWEMTVFHQPNATADTSFPYASEPIVSETLTFNPTTGKLATVPASISLDLTSAGAGLNGQVIDIDISSMSELSGEYEPLTTEINGSTPEAIEAVMIGEDGIVYAQYLNGGLKPLYRLPLATVQSPDQLQVLAGNVFSPSMDSGDLRIGFANESGLGFIESGALENSNVDIATELTSMIESQRNYTANSKVFQTGSDLMDVLVNLKR